MSLCWDYTISAIDTGFVQFILFPCVRPGAVTVGYCQVACSVIMLMALRGIVTAIHQSEARDVIAGPMRGLQSVITGIRAQHSQGLGSPPWPHLCSLQY